MSSKSSKAFKLGRDARTGEFVTVEKARRNPDRYIVEHVPPKDEQDQVFQKFFRAKVKETEKVTGTGLGLFITRMLIEKMGGKIMFTSVEGKGSTFSFFLPIVS